MCVRNIKGMLHYFNNLNSNLKHEMLPAYSEEAIPFIQLDTETNGIFLLISLTCSNRIHHKRGQLRVPERSRGSFRNYFSGRHVQNWQVLPTEPDATKSTKRLWSGSYHSRLHKGAVDLEKAHCRLYSRWRSYKCADLGHGRTGRAR